MFMQVINFIMDAGSSVFMPVIIFALGLVFGLKPSKSFGAGITVGIGFIGINLVIELLANNLMVVIDQLVELYHFKLTAIDVGWPIAASIACKRATPAAHPSKLPFVSSKQSIFLQIPRKMSFIHSSTRSGAVKSRFLTIALNSPP